MEERKEENMKGKTIKKKRPSYTYNCKNQGFLGVALKTFSLLLLLPPNSTSVPHQQKQKQQKQNNTSIPFTPKREVERE